MRKLGAAAQELADLKCGDCRNARDEVRNVRNQTTTEIEVKLIMLPVQVTRGTRAKPSFIGQCQTGEVVGAIPNSTWKVVSLLVGILSILGLIFWWM